MLSVVSCSLPKYGMTLFMINAMNATIRISTTTTTQVNWLPSWIVFIIPPMDMIGANISISKINPKTVLMCVMSFVVLVMSEPFERSFNSWLENFKTFEKTIFLKSLAYSEATLFEKNETSIAQSAARRVNIIMVVPALYMYAISAFAIPTSTIAAVYSGRLKVKFACRISNMIIKIIVFKFIFKGESILVIFKFLYKFVI